MKTMLTSMSVKNGEPGLANQELGVSEMKKDKMKMKYKITLAVMLGLVCIVIATVVACLYFSYYKIEPDTIQVFHIVLRDKSVGSDSIRLDFTVDPEEQLEYSRSPLEGEDASSSEILGLKDFKKGIFAYKVENGSQCLIGKIVPNTTLHALVNGTVEEAVVGTNEMFVYLNYVIHPYVLRLTAGDNIVNFCGDMHAVWMIPMQEYDAKLETKDEKKHARVRRWKCKGWGCEGISHTRCFWTCKWVDERHICSRKCVPK